MKAIDFSLADFYDTDNPNVLAPPTDFDEWVKDPLVQRGLAFFEQPFTAAAAPRTTIIDPQTGKERSMINLTSYNYLGLLHHPEVKQAVIDGVMKYGCGAAGAPKLSGTFVEHHLLCEEMARFKHAGGCMVFSAGVMGNIGGISGLMRKGDVIVMDALAHQSAIDGAKLANCKIELFKHNDANHLADLLKKHDGKRRLIYIEGVYSMDGDLCDLPAIADVSARTGVPMYVDEAHSTLMFGENGRGVGEHFDLEDSIGVSYGTYSKAFGNVGGYICAAAETINYIKCYATTYLFSCSPPPAVVCGIRKSLEVATRDNSLREKLWANTKYFKDRLLGMNLNLGDTQSQVLPIIVGLGREELFRMADALQRKGLFLQPVDYPAVDPGSTRFRISMSAAYDQPMMDEALNIIEDVIVKRKYD